MLKKPVGDHVEDFFITKSGTIFIATGRSIERVSPDGEVSVVHEAVFPRSIFLDGEGNIFFSRDDASTSNEAGWIEKLGIDGSRTVIAGAGGDEFNGDGIPANESNLRRPRGLFVTDEGMIYVGQGGRISRIDPSGVIHTLVEDALVNDILVDGNGDVFFSGPYWVKKVDKDGKVILVAGGIVRGSGSRADGIPATDAQLGNPEGISIDEVGNLFIADLVHNQIRVVWGIAAPRNVPD